MPRKPQSLGQRPREERSAAYEAERRRAKPWRAWYSLAIWKQIRARQLQAQPLCERCEREDRITAATTVNHKIPHRGDWELFIGGPFESCCKPCHDSVVQAEERRGG
jgi:hypothetical protein